MLFNSLTFLVFFFVVYALYLPSGRKVQNAILLAASYVFYGTWDWRFLGLILLSTGVDYLCAQKIERGDEGTRRRWLIVSMGTNLGVLGFFKYFNFFADSLQELTAALGWSMSPFALEIILPVGISFYTFQTMGYTIDVYRRHTQPVDSPFDFALYVAYFPQLVAGPIERSTRLLPQLQGERQITFERVRDGAWLVLFGLFKKVVVADNMAYIVDAVFNAETPASGAATLLAVYAFALQIYGDFSGYTDIARGVSKMLGIDLVVNFRRPYFSTSPRDFWLRWHISLSGWLRDYLYISLGGNRGGMWRTNRNLMATMLLGGLWHGASWMFVIWGGIHGAVLVIHRLALRAVAGLHGLRALFEPLKWLVSVAKGLLMFHVVCAAWIFFRADSMVSALGAFRSVGEGLAMGEADYVTLGLIAACSLPLLLLDLWGEIYERRTSDEDASRFIFTAPAPIRGLVYALLLFYLLVVGAPAGAQFIYFQF